MVIVKNRIYFSFLLFGFVLLGIISCSNRIVPPNTTTYDDSINQQFWTAVWSPDNQLIAVAGVDSTVRIFHAGNLRLYKSYYIPDWIHVLKWNNDNKTLAVATLNEYVMLIDIKSDRFVRYSNLIGPHHSGNGSRAMDWNYQGNLLAVGGLDGVIKVWDKNGNLLKYMDKYPPGTEFTSYYALDWHPYKDEFIACNFEIHLLDRDCNELLQMEHTHKEAIMLCVKWHPSGDFFVIGDYGHNWEGENVPSLLHFWSSTGQHIKSISGSTGPYRNIDWNHNGKLLATASDVLRVWSAEGELLHEGPGDGTNYLWGISWNKHGNQIVTSSQHKSIALWNKNAELIKRIDVTH